VRTTTYPIRVAYVLPDIEMGGTEKHVRDLTARIDRRRFSPVVFATAGGGALEKEFACLEVPVRILNLRLSPRRVGVPKSIGNAVRLLTALSSLFRKDDIGIVHAFLPAPNVAASIAGTIAGIPARVISKRSLCHYKSGRPILSALENAGNFLARAILVNSEAVADDVRRRERFWDGKIRLVYNGIDADVQSPDQIGELFPEFPFLDGKSVITYVANLFPYKGHLDLVDAAHIVAGEFPSACFLLVGRDGGELDAVRARVAALGLGREVLLAGSRQDAVKIMASSSFVVHPSHEEGFSNTILEAMAARKAVVGTKVGGIPEAVVDGETGLLVPPGKPAELACAILALLRDPERARAMGEAGQRRVREEFPIERMVREVERLYESLLAGG
jgi:glycosyltransferase involved in cell wall biosynthesis